MYEKNIFGDVVAVYTDAGVKQISYVYDAWGNFTTTYHNGATSSSPAAMNPYKYRGYYYDWELNLYYLNSRFYDSNTGRFINADNNFSNYNLFTYCGNNPVNRIDPDGEHWYFLWIDDLVKAIEDLMACMSNIIYGKEAYKRSFYDSAGARELWDSRPFQDVETSPEMQIVSEFLYDNDFVADASISVDIPKSNTYVKVGFTKVNSFSKGISASYIHLGAGAGLSKSLGMPISVSCSLGVVSGLESKEQFAGFSYNAGLAAIYGYDYGWSNSGVFVHSFTISNSYGVYGGYDYYWCIS